MICSLLVHHIENSNDNKHWWHFNAERKAYREQHCFPANRPQTPCTVTENILNEGLSTGLKME